ncbi:MAG TPA: xylulokinase [Acidimicrobiales bacterium]|nr:xylulokinase [Acidimicrobiales bacterium]
MALVAGVDSSTSACKVVVRDADTGALVRAGRATHPPGTEVPPAAWWAALEAAAADAGGIDDVAAVAVAGQQHGMVCLDASGEVVRDALLWHDTRSAAAAADLVTELPGGAAAWAEAVGSVPVASFTVTKLRWLAEHEPEHAAATAAVCLPHDWLTWRLQGRAAALTTDRSDASGTGYWSPATGAWRPDLLGLAMGRTPALPRVAGPAEAVGESPRGALVAPGAGDNAAAALGVGAAAGDVVVSIGTSGVVAAVSAAPTADPSGMVAGFADATGAFLPLVCTLNGVGVLQAASRLLGVSAARLAELALSAPPGAEGMVLVPYLAGERTPNRPDATGALHGLTDTNLVAANVARAAVEGLLCGLADGLDHLRRWGVDARRAILVGGGARNPAVVALAPAILGLPVAVPAEGEHVADGAARQAAWACTGGDRPPAWEAAPLTVRDAEPDAGVRDRYAAVRDLTATRPGTVLTRSGELPGRT